MSEPTASKVCEDKRFNKYDPGWTNGYPPFDARYPHQVQHVNCLRNYMDYHRCVAVKGEDYENCYYFKNVYAYKCFQTDIDKWDEQLEKGTFMYKL